MTRVEPGGSRLQAVPSRELTAQETYHGRIGLERITARFKDRDLEARYQNWAEFAHRKERVRALVATMLLHSSVSLLDALKIYDQSYYTADAEWGNYWYLVICVPFTLANAHLARVPAPLAKFSIHNGRWMLTTTTIVVLLLCGLFAKLRLRVTTWAEAFEAEAHLVVEDHGDQVRRSCNETVNDHGPIDLDEQLARSVSTLSDFVRSTYGNLYLASASLVAVIMQALLIVMSVDAPFVLVLGILSLWIIGLSMSLPRSKDPLTPNPGGALIALGGIVLMWCLAFVNELARRRTFRHLAIEIDQNYDLKLQLEALENVEYTENERKAVDMIFGDSRMDEHGFCRRTGVRNIALSELKLEKVLGKGNFGEVIKADYLGTPVALKRMLRQKINDANVAIFRDEISMMASLRHPNITMLIGATWDSYSNIGFVIEFAERGSLWNVLQDRQSNLTWQDPLLGMALGIVRGLEYLHKQEPPIFHRDLKTPNVLVSRSGNVKISDFGISKEKEAGDVKPSPAGSVGSPLWMAPEILRAESYDFPADVWAFGVILCEMDTREQPYNSEQKKMKILPILSLVEKGEIRASMGATAPPKLAQIAEKCLRFNPRERPTFADILTALNDESLAVEIAKFAFSAVGSKGSSPSEAKKQQPKFLKSFTSASSPNLLGDNDVTTPSQASTHKAVEKPRIILEPKTSFGTMAVDSISDESSGDSTTVVIKAEEWC